MISVGVLEGFSFSFFFGRPLPSHLIFKVCKCKGLESEDAGIFDILRPELGEEGQGWFSDQTGRSQI
jgi:hypothetical protein